MLMEQKRGRFWYRSCGLSNVWLSELDYRCCPICGCLDYRVPEMRSLTRKLIEAVIYKTTLLRGEELRFLRHQLGLAAQDLAPMLNLAPEQLEAMERGTLPIEPTEDLLLRLVASQQCLRCRYPMDRLRFIDQSRSDATRVLLKLTGRKWQMVSM